ncbi:lysosomal thioesterase PPT2-like [Mastacembelus armatus]|uniref:palmitoyl-CoA hydrolase n=1 Tax=Mastacembelus armatus TaxID=205130 RepID=A0A3Q3LZK4_9TELE|nr:lysosomal thioesterase PPT2-like [Mastacembelus armatus]
MLLIFRTRPKTSPVSSPKSVLWSVRDLTADLREMNTQRLLLLLLLVVLLLVVPLLLLWPPGVSVGRYKPVIIVHGLFDGPKELANLSNYITKVHPGTAVTVIDLYPYIFSLKPLWVQVKGFRIAIQSIMQQSPDGVHILCYSQGGLICRALLSTTPNHTVNTFISLSSPLAGQYGDTGHVPGCLKTLAYKICYNKCGQKVSVCDYWNDPHHRSRYLQGNSFLTLLNGDIPHNQMKAWRENFLRIKNLVLIGGPDDGVITPWQSSHFGFYDSNENVVEMRNQEYYKNDTFGLKTLDDRGKVSVCVQSGVEHTKWHSNYSVFMSCIEKWLT